MTLENPYHVAVIGAGPAGLFAAKELVKNGVHVTVFNRDIKPGGLAEYGIYPEKIKMKEALRRQFLNCLEPEEVNYYGNVQVGEHSQVTLDWIREAGFDAILVASGAQGTKWVGVPGEDLDGVYHAKDIVYHYNLLPPFSEQPFPIGKHVIIVGVGNVMMDIARYLISDIKVEKVTAIARRGPAETKFSRKEMEYVGSNFDLDEYKNELMKAAPVMRSIYQDPELSLKFILESLESCHEPNSTTTFCLKFLSSIKKILGNESNQVCAVEVEENTLVEENGVIRAKGTGTRTILDCDTVIFAIGDGVDPEFGLPLDHYEFFKNPYPRFPIEEISYEAYDPQSHEPIDDVFFAGWARKTSDGLVGLARKDGINAAHVILSYLKTKKPDTAFDAEKLRGRIDELKEEVVEKNDLVKLMEAEKEQGKLLGVADFKFSTNVDMLKAIQRSKVTD